MENFNTYLDWETVATLMEREQVGEVNWDERFFICPECQEPVYEEDYSCFPTLVETEKTPIPFCPICEEPLF